MGETMNLHPLHPSVPIKRAYAGMDFDLIRYSPRAIDGCHSVQRVQTPASGPNQEERESGQTNGQNSCTYFQVGRPCGRLDTMQYENGWLCHKPPWWVKPL